MRDIEENRICNILREDLLLHPGGVLETSLQDSVLRTYDRREYPSSSTSS